jgi:hypothetical protein
MGRLARIWAPDGGVGGALSGYAWWGVMPMWESGDAGG